jgi:hypothetical protein
MLRYIETVSAHIYPSKLVKVIIPRDGKHTKKNYGVRENFFFLNCISPYAV